MNKSPFEPFRAWGSIGGLKAAKRMTKAQRIARARKAGLARRKNKK